MTRLAHRKVTHVLAAVIASASLTLLAASPAPATTVDECQAELTELSNSLAGHAAAFTNARDVERLDAKVEAAAAKLAEGKNADAIAKVTDFRSTVNQLATAAKPKVVPGVAASLDAQAQEAVTCIEAIGA